jgi:hypothetical protein
MQGKRENILEFFSRVKLFGLQGTAFTDEYCMAFEPARSC